MGTAQLQVSEDLVRDLLDKISYPCPIYDLAGEKAVENNDVLQLGEYEHARFQRFVESSLQPGPIYDNPLVERLEAARNPFRDFVENESFHEMLDIPGLRLGPDRPFGDIERDLAKFREEMRDYEAIAKARRVARDGITDGVATFLADLLLDERLRTRCLQLGGGDKKLLYLLELAEVDGEKLLGKSPEELSTALGISDDDPGAEGFLGDLWDRAKRAAKRLFQKLLRRAWRVVSQAARNIADNVVWLVKRFFEGTRVDLLGLKVTLQSSPKVTFSGDPRIEDAKLIVDVETRIVLKSKVTGVSISWPFSKSGIRVSAGVGLRFRGDGATLWLSGSFIKAEVDLLIVNVSIKSRLNKKFEGKEFKVLDLSRVAFTLPKIGVPVAIRSVEAGTANRNLRLVLDLD